MNNIVRVLSVGDDAQDIQRIRTSIKDRFSLITRFSDLEIKLLWEGFSDSMCAGWLIVHEETLNQFVSWLEE